MGVIEVNDLVKRYKKATTNAVDGISLSIDEGQFFSLLGPNGAGKTTTVSILTTTLAKTSGNVLIASYDLDKQAEKVRQKIGVIFQKPSLDLDLTAEENVRFHAVLYGLYPFRLSYGMMPSAYRRKVSNLAEILGIKNEIFKPIKTFSGGMKRKLEIIRSLIHSPKILFLDEPTTGLDPVGRANLWKYLQEVRKKENMTVFLTTHYLEEAEGADQVGIVNHGKLISLGTPNQIKRDLVEEYLLVDAKDREALKKELGGKKLKFVEDNGLKVMVKAEEIQKVIASIKTKLTTIRIHTPSLEEAYLEIINQQK